MSINLSNCEIRTPEKPQDLQYLYRMLAEVFPVEKKLFEHIISGAYTFYNWEPHTLYFGDEPVGNVSMVMFQIHDGDCLQKTAGIASVATLERYRGMGIAKHLMNHVLKTVDLQNLPSILFTSLPDVYAGLGYQLVNQEIKQTAVKKVAGSNGLSILRITQLNREILKTAGKLYDEWGTCDDKLLRNREYWRYYGDSVNNSDHTEIAFCRKDDKILGYTRLEYEDDRVLLDEFYAPPESREINTALWNWVCDAAEEKNIQLISIALPPAHWLWNFLKLNCLTMQLESGVEREKFMVRMPKNKQLNWLARLHWSLSDKF